MPKWLKTIGSMFCDSTGHLDMGRVLAFKTMTAFSVAFLYVTFKNPHVAVNWTEVGTGYGAVMVGCVAFIGGKEYALSKANSINANQ